MLNPDHIRILIEAALPGADVAVEDYTGGGDHFRTRVAWAGFAGKSRVEQHQAVYAAVQHGLGRIDTRIVHCNNGATGRGEGAVVTEAEVATREELAADIAQKISTNAVILFMKGTPEQPYCGFSMRTVRALDSVGASFVAVNVLVDPRIREVLSEQSNWPTIPQLFVDGTLVGGCDIVTEMAESGELAELIASSAS